MAADNKKAGAVLPLMLFLTMSPVLHGQQSSADPKGANFSDAQPAARSRVQKTSALQDLREREFPAPGLLKALKVDGEASRREPK